MVNKIKYKLKNIYIYIINTEIAIPTIFHDILNLDISYSYFYGLFPYS